VYIYSFFGGFGGDLYLGSPLVSLESVTTIRSANDIRNTTQINIISSIVILLVFCFTLC